MALPTPIDPYKMPLYRALDRLATMLGGSAVGGGQGGTKTVPPPFGVKKVERFATAKPAELPCWAIVKREFGPYSRKDMMNVTNTHKVDLLLLWCPIDRYDSDFDKVMEKYLDDVPLWLDQHHQLKDDDGEIYCLDVMNEMGGEYFSDPLLPLVYGGQAYIGIRFGLQIETVFQYLADF